MTYRVERGDGLELGNNRSQKSISAGWKSRLSPLLELGAGVGNLKS